MEPLRGTAGVVSRTQGARRSAATLGYYMKPLRGIPSTQLQNAIEWGTPNPTTQLRNSDSSDSCDSW